MNRRVLVIAPHMDDEVMGVGGTICKHVACGDVVKVLIIANRIYGHTLDQSKVDIEESHALGAKEIFGYEELEFGRLPDEKLSEHFMEIATLIESVAKAFRPEIVYVNHRGDPHQDHKTVFEAAYISLRAAGAVRDTLRRVVVYETPSSTEQSPPFGDYAFQPTLFVDIHPFLNRKVEALRCYSTELREFPHARSPEGVDAYARMRGLQSNLCAAEGFMLLREIWV